ncbi:MAG: hypothetical protein LQ346_005944 [Caloplaca aetnensis]|nr:MAG: hypothetical protein LQ346_005944 [Caloplaca aetnensis]
MARSNVLHHCDPTNNLLHNISSTFHTCVPTPLAFVSTTLGILSIVSWLFAQLPQIIKNHKLKSASGLSVYFLAEWFLGDLTNLLGALLTGQAAWQVVVAAYYVTVDICLVTQYFWYTHYKSWRENAAGELDLDYNETGDGTSRNALVGEAQSFRPRSTSNSQAMVSKKPDEESKSSTKPRSIGNSFKHNLSFSWSPKEKGTPGSSYRSIRRPQNAPSPGVSPNTLLLVSLVFAVLSKASPLNSTPHDHNTSTQKVETLQIAGRILSWMSTLLYLGSRLPQIVKNYRRKSTSGLSPTLFIAAFFGNLFYSTSLLANPLAWDDSGPYGLRGWAGPEGNDSLNWITLAAPFFLGAAGVLMMDAIIGVQFLLFGEAQEAPKIVVVRDERGRSQWRKVSGWMRGWVPSPAPRTREGVERPLLETTLSHDQHRYGSA